MLEQETIKTFITVVECNSFSKASKILFKTPATITYRIKALEQQLGIQLFKRTTRSITLTLAGEHLYLNCCNWLRWIENMPEELKEIQNGIERQINITINNLLFSPEAVADLLAYLKKQFPFTQFNIKRQVYMGVWDSLLNGDSHFAIGATGWESLDSMFNIYPIGEVSWVFVAEQNHPLAKMTGRLNNETLRNFDAINVEDTSIKMSKRVGWLLPGQREIIVPNLQTKLVCHLKGVSAGFLPKRLCQPYLDSNQLVTCDVVNARLPSQLSIAWRKSNMGKVINELVTLFTNNHPIAEAFYTNIDIKR
ncbi:DNA-binding transcriptional LysR family regulator [Orbus hercynius]|uniref:DNA-binding transcriptional LysR family regulator n=1 Tax=Orbus hercynius TaxID=593135 RepID=A0A495RJ40_9GAMM|nr:HTH-type transcriptional activator AllS [Orbus hercynius]RKS87465.1 DNA-binding transcriptional LysR family regulator [Orbus hercynius]